MKIIFNFFLVLALLFMGCNQKNITYLSASETDTPEDITNNTLQFTQSIESMDDIQAVNLNHEIIHDIDTSMDPFLLYYLRNYPTIQINTSENVLIQRISYQNFEKKEIIYGDEVPGTFTYSIYLFQNGVFNGIDRAKTVNGKLLIRSKSAEIIRSVDGLILTINTYVPDASGIDSLSYQHIYDKVNNRIVANEGLRNGAIGAVIVEDESKFYYYEDHQRYNKSPDSPDIIIEFINDDVIITVYNFLFQRISSRFYFTNGILMKREYNDSIETYTVSSGIGEIIVTDISGELIERRVLERRINDAGYLEYEAVKYPSGTGYEYFITKDLLQ